VDYLDGFADHLSAIGRSPQTVKGYVAAVARVLGQVGGENLSSVTPIDLAEWRRSRSGAARPATVNLEIDAVRQFFRWAHASGLASTDPSERLKHVPPDARMAPKWLSRQEQHRLLREVQKEVQAANTDERRSRAARGGALVALMLHAGLRVSEVCALDMADIEISERKGTVTVRQGKGGKRREVPLNLDAREAIQAWISFRGGAEGPLFPDGKGGRIVPRTAQATVSRLGAGAGLHVTAHQLRHTFCHELVERGGVSLDKVALLAGHTTASGLPRLETTVRYTLPSAGELVEAVESIEW